MKRYWIIPVIALLGTSCISLKNHNETRADTMRAESKAETLRERNEMLIERNNRLTEQVEHLATDTARLMRENRVLRSSGGKISGDVSAELSNLLLQIQENEIEIRELKRRLGEE